MKRYVIIGNGVAAAGCIEGIRGTDSKTPITVISEEKHPVYCRPLISYYLEHKTDMEKMNYRPADFYEKNGCEVLYGRKAVSLDKENKKVILDDGSSVSYTSVCVAAGSSPFVPPFEGLEAVEKKFAFMTLEDTLALEKAVNEDSDVLIVGAGLIGLKCAEGLYGRVKSITVCDLADRVLSSILDTDCAAVMQKRLEENGIKFMLSDTVTKFSKNTAYTKSGAEVKFDAVVLAVGVRANTELVKNAGGETGRGIIVDDGMRTSIEDVFAAGDCTEGNDISSGQKKVLALLPNAYMQGFAAGVNMAGGKSLFDKAVPMNSVGFFGLHAMTAGSYDGELTDCSDNGNIKRFFIRDGLLCGFILIGETERAGIYTSLIREKTPLDTVDFGMLMKTATSAAFTEENRRKKFGGVV